MITASQDDVARLFARLGVANDYHIFDKSAAALEGDWEIVRALSRPLTTPPSLDAPAVPPPTRKSAHPAAAVEIDALLRRLAP